MNVISHGHPTPHRLYARLCFTAYNMQSFSDQMDTSDNFRTAVFARNCAFGAECRTSLLSKVENSFTIKYSNISKRIIIKYAAVRVPTYNYMYHTFCNAVYGRLLIYHTLYRRRQRSNEVAFLKSWRTPIFSPYPSLKKFLEQRRRMRDLTYFPSTPTMPELLLWGRMAGAADSDPRLREESIEVYALD